MSARPLHKKILFSAVTALLVLLALEGAAQAVERWALPYRRSIPIAQPGMERARSFTQAAQRAEEEILQGIPMVASAERGWSLPPSAELRVKDVVLRTNSMGMRGPEPGPKAEREVRLLTLGDSSIFGDGVNEEQVFSTVAAERLSAAWGVPVGAVIGATPGHDSRQSRETLRMFGEKIDPDWVIIGNLWSDIYIADNTLDPQSVQTYLPDPGPLRRLASYRLGWRLLAPWLNQQKVRFIASQDDIGALSGPKITRTPLPQYIDNLRAMAAAATQLGARPAFLCLAAPMDLDRVPPPDTVQQFRLAMETVAEETGAPWIDAPAAFRAAGATIGFFDDQVHPNAIGHALLGAVVAERLAREPAIPAP